MKRFLEILIVLFAWFALLVQFYLMLQNRILPVGETIMRFFTYLTILTNLMVAIYFTYRLVRRNNNTSIFNHPAFLTATTVYIALVGIVYQFALRHVWQPTGMQKIVDELLHTIIPALGIIFWAVSQDKLRVQWRHLPLFLIYPVTYIILVFSRGIYSGYYPYYFIDVKTLGWLPVIRNAVFVVLIFFALTAMFIGVARTMAKRSSGIRGKYPVI